MPRDGTATRDRILDTAEEVILDRGYSGMTVDRLIESAGLTKGAFFYHFRSKDDLARALIARFAARDTQTWKETWARAERLATDPLERVRVFIGLFIETFESLTTPHPGCLYASYVYEWQTFDAGTQEVVAESFRMWRRELGARFEHVFEKYPPRLPADAESLADEFTVIIEGAFVMGKAMDEPQMVAVQLRHFRNYVELLFRREG